jgi:hypothetical protein
MLFLLAGVYRCLLDVLICGRNAILLEAEAIQTAIFSGLLLALLLHFAGQRGDLLEILEVGHDLDACLHLVKLRLQGRFSRFMQSLLKLLLADCRRELYGVFFNH